MLPNKNVFCNTPWYEVHIYWDGSFGICCQENHKLHSNDQHYNIANMSMIEWFNSEPVRQFRQKMQSDQLPSECLRCHLEEQNRGNSRRLKSNQKSIIFTRQAFEESFVQSPGYEYFEHSRQNQGYTNTYPVDMHIDLGNFCNLACKMCNARASSTIASQHVRWGIQQDRKYLGTDWTADKSVWNSFKQQLIEIPGLNNIHFMGGETLLTPRFENLVDWLIENQRFDLCLSFVTNGTVFKPELIDKLIKFRRVGLEISIESTTQHNSYVRQGTNTSQVLENIEKYRSYCNNDSITTTLRTAPSLLTVGSYVELLNYAMTHKLLIKSNLCHDPDFLRIENLPHTVKVIYKEKILDFLSQFDDRHKRDYNASNPWLFKEAIKEQAEMCLSSLEKPQPDNVDQLLQKLVNHCRRWDQVYNLNAKELYPELTEVWDKYGY
jgi:MoaA/NifB/PqqE/SkfB family radical SAM enzyme